MTTHDQKVVMSGQRRGFIEKMNFRPINRWEIAWLVNLRDFEIRYIASMMTTHDQKVVMSGQRRGFIEKMNFRPINR